MPRGVQQSPWTWQAVDYTRTNSIQITVTFDNTSRALTGATVSRDQACVFTKIYIGLGSDGRPDSTPRAINVPAGTTTVTAAQMAAVGLHSIDDVLALQITAGP